MPGMGHSVEALLDPRLEAVVRADWATLSDRGIGRVPGEGYRPHVTLTYATSYDEDGEGRLREVISEGAGLPVDVRLGGLVVFGGHHGFVLARAVVPSRTLLDLHERVAGLLAEVPGLSRTARPGAWTPHVTLARLESAQGVGAAVGALVGGRERAGQVIAVRHWDGDRRLEQIVATTTPRGDQGSIGDQGNSGDQGS